MANSAHLRGRDWLNFTRVSNERWTDDNVVLMGDAAHTAHFSVGSGTKLAMEDAIGLADALERSTDDLSTRAARSTKTARKLEVLKLQNAARNSTEWFENVARYATLPPEQFAYSLLTRSQRIGHENLRLRDTTYVERVERWFGGRSRSRRCSCRSGCANSNCATASSSRRWTCTARSTVRPTISISCTWARARSAAPAWSSPR